MTPYANNMKEIAYLNSKYPEDSYEVLVTSSLLLELINRQYELKQIKREGKRVLIEIFQ